MIGLYREPTGESLRGRRDAGRRRLRVAEHAGLRLRLSRRRSRRPARSARRQRPHRRHGAQHPRQRRLRAAAAALSESTARAAFAMSPRKSAASFASPRSAAAWPTATSIATAISTSCITTNNGPAYLYRNDQLAGNRSIRFRLVGTKSNRDAIGATVRIFSWRHQAVAPGEERLELSVAVRTAGNLRPGETRPHRPRGHRLAQRTNRRIQESRGRPRYECTEGKGIAPLDGY